MRMSFIPGLDSQSSSTRDKIIHILAANPGSSTKKISGILKKQYAVNVTYQAVHKTLKQMVGEGILIIEKKGYSLNRNWIEKLKKFVTKLDANSNYSKDAIDYERILDLNSIEPITFVIKTRKEFDDFYFKIRTLLVQKLIDLPVEERLIFHHIGHLYLALAYPSLEHQFIEELKKVKANAYFLCQGSSPVDKWAASVYNNSPVTILLDSVSELTRLIFLYPQFMIEVYYSYRTLEIFKRLYNSKWGIEQVKLSEILGELYSYDDPIQVVINKDPKIIQTVKKISINLLRKVKNENIVLPETTEDIITDKDIKGISNLRRFIPKDYCRDAAKFVLENKGRIGIITGFYVKGEDTIETDGILGAIILSNFLEKIGCEVIFIADKYLVDILKKVTKKRVLPFKITSLSESRSIAKEVLQELNLDLLIAIERCGLAEDDHYYNIRKEDITEHTAKMDVFFELFDKTLSIADTGNEIGMGNLLREIKETSIDIIPSKTRCKHLIISTTTNWGCYGLITEISKLLNKQIIVVDEEPILKKLVSVGCIDGITKLRTLTYDTFNLSQNKEIIDALNIVLKNSIKKQESEFGL